MLNLRSKVVGGMGALAIAGALAATGLTAASASQAAGAGTPGFEHFQLVTTSPAPTAPEAIIVTGAFTAGGVNHPGNRVDTAVFPNGTFKIAHSLSLIHISEPTRPY